MGEVVNLRRARKSQERRREESQAEQNRVSFGLSKAEKQLAEKVRAQATRTLDGHLRENGEMPADPDKTSS
jgi:hypothetical protein